MLDPALGAVRRTGYGGVLGHGCGRHRHPLDQALDVGGPMPQLFVDVDAYSFGHLLQVHQEVDEISIAGVCRDAPGRGVRLSQVAEVGELGELAADRGRRQVDEIAALQRLGAHRHGAGRELLHHRPQDCLLSVFHAFWHSPDESADYSTARAIWLCRSMPRRVGATRPSTVSINPARARRPSSSSKPGRGATPSAVRNPSIRASAPVLRSGSSSPSARGTGHAAMYSRGRAMFHHRQARVPSVAYEWAPAPAPYTGRHRQYARLWRDSNPGRAQLETS